MKPIDVVVMAMWLCIVLFIAYGTNKETAVDKLPYSIVDANGVEHRTACPGYDLISSDSVMLCNGVKIKYSKKKPINVIPK